MTYFFIISVMFSSAPSNSEREKTVSDQGNIIMFSPLAILCFSYQTLVHVTVSTYLYVQVHSISYLKFILFNQIIIVLITYCFEKQIAQVIYILETTNFQYLMLKVCFKFYQTSAVQISVVPEVTAFVSWTQVQNYIIVYPYFI